MPLENLIVFLMKSSLNPQPNMKLKKSNIIIFSLRYELQQSTESNSVRPSHYSTSVSSSAIIPYLLSRSAPDVKHLGQYLMRLIILINI